MADTDTVTIQLAEMLRHPEDLDKIPALKSEFTRKKAAIDGQLKMGLKEQLDVTQGGMTSIGDGQRIVNQIKEEMMKIDRLCAEAQNMIGDFPNINLVSRVHRNFSQVETMKSQIESFPTKLDNIERLLGEDDNDLDNQPNLLEIHYGLTQLRNTRDEILDQLRKVGDSSLEGELETIFNRLDDVVDWFDEHIGNICTRLIQHVQGDNSSLIVRLAVIVEEEEKNDNQVKALQDAQKDHKELASRFKSIKAGPKQLRGYKEKFLGCIKLYAEAQFKEAKEEFLQDPDKLVKDLKWFFNDLFAVKMGMVRLMPKKWQIFKTYSNIYHTLMHDWLIEFVSDPDLSPPQMLAIIHWSEKYYAKMAKLGWKEPDLEPQLLDNREQELVREWRQVIVKTVNDWMERMFTADKKNLLERSPDSLEQDENGYFRRNTLADMWRMLHEQTSFAATAERTDVMEGVVDAMFRALKSRQTSWQKLLDDEAAQYKDPTSEADGMSGLQDWLIALANDQIACIDDNEAAGTLGYLTRFRTDFEPHVSSSYLLQATNEVENLRDGYVDLSTHCITVFVSLIFAVDFRTILPEFFTPRWYQEFGMKRITSTFSDYIGDYQAVIHPSLLDIVIEEFSDELLVRYLLSVRNKGARFRRSEPFNEKFKDDVITVFEFFNQYPDFEAIRQQWRVVDWLVRLLEADRKEVVDLYENFKREYWDLQLSWVESVLRARDDFERAMLSGVKARAAGVHVERGAETIMSKVK
ncbi:MAG: SNARE-binding exocyst subunit S6 [Cirrosporium novae-zelandiae]|nr:MAG: SNARE-binding exocyst subunit S6 [Cirrosporium novae-zelandiae]